jgi:hypothetical protein
MNAKALGTRILVFRIYSEQEKDGLSVENTARQTAKSI